ncbi:MAG TPA: hypothetical protein VGY77_10745, partial [Gemmataceae bacterium]|nr:hypothetical protein [Gemmataceae bacterium]
MNTSNSYSADPDAFESIDRRQFMTLMGASLALAGLNGCNVQPPAEKIMPFVQSPEDIVPGKPLFFATAMTLLGHTTGLLVESHEGRPTKIEGNELHPASLGATDAFAQAAVLDLYDPDRSQTVTYRGRIHSWEEAVKAIRGKLSQLREDMGRGLHFLTQTVSSPTLANQFEILFQEFPGAQWHQYEPAGRDMARAGSRLAFGQYVNSYCRFDRADVVLSLDADFLAPGPGHLRYVRDFTAKRKVRAAAGPAESAQMNRLYVVECTPTITGAKADHRLPMRAGEIEAFARALAAQLDDSLKPVAGAAVRPNAAEFLRDLAFDLKSHRGSSIVLAGDQQPAPVHALAHAMNLALGNAGKTILFTDPVEARPVNQLSSLQELVNDMERGRVQLLVILGGNPVYNAPIDLSFSDTLTNLSKKLTNQNALTVHLGPYQDETASLCQWHVPEAHFLECWSDGRAFDGTASIVQPLIAPLYGGKSPHELLAIFTDFPGRPGYEIVKETWRRYWNNRNDSGEYEKFWEKSLHDGVVAGTALSPKSVSLQPGWEKEIGQGSAPGSEPGLEISFRPDPTVFDGRFANNGWLQELPKPLTNLTWDNAALLSPRTAEKLGLTSKVGVHGGEHGEIFADLVELNYRGRKLRTPIWIIPGHADDSITLHLGYGRTR